MTILFFSLFTWVSLAAPLPVVDADTIAAQPGLVAVAFSQDGACPTSPWDSASLTTAAEAQIQPVQVARNNRSVALLLQDAPRTRAMALAFRDGHYIDAVCGCIDSHELSLWFMALAQHHTYADLIATDSKAPLDIVASMSISQRHHCANRPQAAFTPLEALWTRIPREAPSQRIMRLQHLARDMAMLARSSPAVTQKVQVLRDQLETQKNTDADALEDWIVLNRILLQDDKTFAWFEASTSDPTRASLMQWQAPTYFDMLIARDRWADAGALVDDPAKWLKRDLVMPGASKRLPQIYVALLAANQRGPAGKYLRALHEATPENARCGVIALASQAGVKDKLPRSVTRDCPASQSAPTP